MPFRCCSSSLLGMASVAYRWSVGLLACCCRRALRRPRCVRCWRGAGMVVCLGGFCRRHGVGSPSAAAFVVVAMIVVLYKLVVRWF
jgi:hypothetical protein